jgi:2-oxo-4-hydroxy-4-carboxy-5-ureidoimidazoline decarboxylase
MKLPFDLANDSQQAFMKVFGGLYEHSPWVAEKAYVNTKQNKSYNDLECFYTLLCKTMLAADGSTHYALICSHPILAGKKAQQNELTHFSTSEQQSAGLSGCSDDEITLFQRLNCQYKDKFGFPFIMAVKEKNKSEIKVGFSDRQTNSIEKEKQNALAEINKIAWLRIKEIYEI